MEEYMKMHLKIAVLSVMAMMSSGISGSASTVDIYNYGIINNMRITLKGVEAIAYFDCPATPQVSFNSLDSGWELTGSIQKQALWKRLNVKKCKNTGLQVTVTTDKGTVVLHGPQLSADQVWYGIRGEITATHTLTVTLTCSQSKNPGNIVDQKTITWD
jgi:hypothetical protein